MLETARLNVSVAPIVFLQFGGVTSTTSTGVPVNNQEIGRTDLSGRLFLPNLASYFENQVSIDDKDVPIDYTLSEVMRTVSPPLRSGSVIPFAAKKFQAVTGFVRLRREGETKALEVYEGKGAVAGKEIAFPTGKGGEFYLGDIPPGTHRAQVQYNGNRCGFDIVVPRSDEMILDLGVLFCEDVR